MKIELPCTRELDFEGPESLGMRLLSDSLLRVFPGPPFLRPNCAKDDTITKISSKWYSKRCTWGVWISSYLSLCAPVGTQGCPKEVQGGPKEAQGSHQSCKRLPKFTKMRAQGYKMKPNIVKNQNKHSRALFLYFSLFGSRFCRQSTK